MVSTIKAYMRQDQKCIGRHFYRFEDSILIRDIEAGLLDVRSRFKSQVRYLQYNEICTNISSVIFSPQISGQKLSE